MDDKTAEIPSLKEFDEQRKERAAHMERSRSMQTKKQMQRSAEKSKKPSRNKGEVDSTRRFSQKDMDATVRFDSSRKASGADRTERNLRKASVNTDDLGSTRVFDTPVESSKAKKSNDKGERRDPPLRRTASDRGRTGTIEASKDRKSPADRRVHTEQSPRRQKTTAERPAAAPRTYARERNNLNGGQASDVAGTRQSRSTRPHPPVSAESAHRKADKKPKKPLSPKVRKFRSIMAYCAIMLVILVVGVVLSLTVLFKTEQINVSGNGEYSVQEIVEVSGLHKGENIFMAQKGRASKRIEKAYPYVEEADVYCVFPNAINIDLTMAKPACVIESLGGYYVVSDKGKVLEVASTTDEIDAPVIEGITVEGKAPGEYVKFGTDVIGTALEELFEAFREYGCTKITAINVSTADDETVELKYVYDNRIVVYIGIPEYINYKVQTAHTIITEKIDVNGATLAGDLDVSMCYESKKSYFNQYTILSPNVPPATEPTDPTATVETTEAEVYVYDDSDSVSETYYEEETQALESPPTEEIATETYVYE